MAALTVAAIDLTGVVLADVDAAAAGGGDTFANNGNTLFYIDNQNGSGMSVTFDDTGTPTPSGTLDAFDHDVTVAIGANEAQLLGPFDTQRFGTTVSVTYTAVTSLFVAPLRF